MKRVAVLCPGPSLNEMWPHCPAQFDVVVGVNTAALRYSVDWMCAVDRDLIQRAVPRYVWGLTRGFATNTGWLYHLEFLGFKRALLPQRSIWTFPNALWFARELAEGGTIHVYGFDCTDTPHADGSLGTIGPDRWRRELPSVRGAIDGARLTLHGNASAAVRAYVMGETAELVL